MLTLPEMSQTSTKTVISKNLKCFPKKFNLRSLISHTEIKYKIMSIVRVYSLQFSSDFVFSDKDFVLSNLNFCLPKIKQLQVVQVVHSTPVNHHRYKSEMEISTRADSWPDEKAEWECEITGMKMIHIVPAILRHIMVSALSQLCTLDEVKIKITLTYYYLTK